MSNNSQNPLELLKHLRMIHFLLVLASLLTCIPILSGPSGDVRIAQGQLKRISTVRSSWATWTKRFALEQITWLNSLGVAGLDLEPEYAFIETQQLKGRGLARMTESSI